MTEKTNNYTKRAPFPRYEVNCSKFDAFEKLIHWRSSCQIKTTQ